MGLLNEMGKNQSSSNRQRSLSDSGGTQDEGNFINYLNLFFD